MAANAIAQCFMCHAADNSAEAHVVVTNTVIAVLDRFPIRPGHVIIFPRSHIDHWSGMPTGLYLEIMLLARSLLEAVERSLGVRAGMFFGGKQFPDHCHIHVLPVANGLKATFRDLDANPRLEALSSESKALAKRIAGALPAGRSET